MYSVVSVENQRTVGTTTTTTVATLDRTTSSSSAGWLTNNRGNKKDPPNKHGYTAYWLVIILPFLRGPDCIWLFFLSSLSLFNRTQPTFAPLRGELF